MPELPEVETIAREMHQRLCGSRITQVEVEWQRTIAKPSANSFISQIKGLSIRAVGRRAKYLVFTLEGKNHLLRFLLIHLRMSGQLDLMSKSAQRSKHDRVVFTLDDMRELRFNDVRKFGKLYLVDDQSEITQTLGPEALQISLQDFFTRLKIRRGSIKSVLLDQRFIAGLGNIYVDESLWRAKIHPLKKADSLSINQAKALYSSIRKSLNLAIKASGTNIGDGVYPKGAYIPKIYGRQGKSCYHCKHIVERIVVGQRGTHLCASCQIF